MTGKEFFGKLLNNRPEEESSWGSEKAHEDASQGVPDVDEHVDSERQDASPRGSYDESTQAGPASYVDAPVTELRAPDPSQSHADVDDDIPQMRVSSAEQRDSYTEDASYHAAEQHGVDRFQDPGGDGLSTDLPDVQPSNGVHTEAATNSYSETQDVPEKHDGSQPERGASEYRSHRQEGERYDTDHTHTDAASQAPTDTAADTPVYDEKGASAYLDQSDPQEYQDVHADAVSPRKHAAESSDQRGQHALVEPGANGLATNGSHQPYPEEANTHAPPQPSQPHHPTVEQANGPSLTDQSTTVENNAAPVTHREANHVSLQEARAPTQPQSETPAPPKAPDAQKGSKDKDADKAAESSAKASKVSDADVEHVKDRVVHRLLEKNVVTVDQVKSAIADRNKQGLKATLWRILAQQATVDRERVYREAALTYAFEERKIDEGSIDVDFIRQVADVFPEKKRNRLIELHIVPIGYEFEQQTQLLRVVFITHDPSLPVVRELMQDLNLERYELQYASESTVKDLLARAFPKKNEYLERMTDDPLAYDLGTSFEDEKSELIDEDALEAEINRSSLINLFEGALVEAVHRGASDIHIYPNPRRQIEIHFRVDGRLLHWHTEDKIHPESLLAVIKDNTMNVDRFERDMAQDGFIQRKVDDTLIRYRVSILPIASASNNIHAESIVIRVLDDRKVITDLSKLGLLKGALERFDMAIRQPHGMVILTGPTGSGKSTTLVASLHQVVTPEVNVLTVEDPVEYIIPGVRQIKLNHKLGLEGALRAILRHDPDVVMVGEMRDKATAELAVKLANTGHLTFSTLHTNDAPSAVSRLYKMGLEPFLIAYAINLVVAQRLLRTLCPKCKIVDNDPDYVLLERLGFSEEDLREYTIFKASGDPTCKTCKGMGYKGRRAISEAMYFSREIRHMIVESDTKIDEDGLRDMARQEGMLTLQDSAREVVKMGETSVDEMMRVTMTEE